MGPALFFVSTWRTWHPSWRSAQESARASEPLSSLPPRVLPETKGGRACFQKHSGRRTGLTGLVPGEPASSAKWGTNKYWQRPSVKAFINTDTRFSTDVFILSPFTVARLSINTLSPLYNPPTQMVHGEHGLFQRDHAGVVLKKAATVVIRSRCTAVTVMLGVHSGCQACAGPFTASSPQGNSDLHFRREAVEASGV